LEFFYAAPPSDREGPARPFQMLALAARLRLASARALIFKKIDAASKWRSFGRGQRRAGLFGK